MGDLRTIDNPVAPDPLAATMAIDAIGGYYVKKYEYEQELAAETLIQGLLALAQMIIYWNLYDDMLEKRDQAIDDLIAFLDKLQGYKQQDLPILRAKKDALSIPEPSANSCTEGGRYRSESLRDGQAVDQTSMDFIHCSCAGIPTGWGLHDGILSAGLGSATAGSYMASNAKRRQEAFRKAKINIVQTAQAGMKAVFKASDIIGYYSHAASIYSGLTDIFISGFNSGGAALGVALGKMGTGTVDPGIVRTDNLGITGSSTTPITIGSRTVQS